MLRLSKKARKAILIALAVIAGIRNLHASELDALRISSDIQLTCTPYGTILSPVFASSDPATSDYSQLVSYTRAGDSAIWTGHYLAAEAFRYRVTGSPEALNNILRTLYGIRALLDVTGSDVLARYYAPADSPFAAAVQREEGGHGIYYAQRPEQTYFWIGNTSRDQYSGVMFGLSITYDLVDDPNIRELIRSHVTRILNYLLNHGWNVVMPDGSISTTFLHRPDQMLSFLQVGRRINPGKFAWVYGLYRALYASSVALPIIFDNAEDHDHYFKFNINYINLFNLVRLEESGSLFKGMYMNAYEKLRGTTETHGNAHFNMLDRALRGANAGRDSETIQLLDAWLQRTRRDYWMDLRGKYAACGDDRACASIPIQDRINTDFLWQRSPFLLYGGGLGTIQTPAVDYILPYWMARYYGILTD